MTAVTIFSQRQKRQEERQERQLQGGAGRMQASSQGDTGTVI